MAGQHEQAIADALADMGQQLTPGASAGPDEIIALPSRVAEIRTRTALQETLLELLTGAASTGTEFAIAELEDRVAAGFAWDQAHRQAMDWAQAYQFNLVSQIDASTQRFLSAQVTEWMESGEPLGELASRLSWAFGPERAEVIAQTEATRGFAQGALASYRTSGVVGAVEWYTVADDRVCPICGPLNGMTSDLQYPDFGGLDGPPAHPKCRCRLAPIVMEPEG